MKRQVVITGFSAIVPAAARQLPAFSEDGESPEEVPQPPEASEITLFDVPEGAPEHAFEVDDFDLNAHIPTKYPFIDRTSAFALAVAAGALQKAGLLDDSGKVVSETGCCFATAFGCLETMAFYNRKITEKNPKFAPPLPFTHSYPNSPTALLAIQFGLRGYSMSFAGGSVSGLEALDAGFRAVSSGLAERIVVTAADTLSEQLFKHLLADGKLASSPPHGAWNENNDGLSPGEGATALVLESESICRERGAEPVAVLLGTGSAGASGVSGNETALADAYRRAFRSGRVKSEEVDIVFLDSPSDPARDAVEERLSADIFSGPTRPAFAALKLRTGDMFAASPPASVAWAAEILHAGITTGLYRPGNGDRLKLAAVHAAGDGTAAVTLVAHPRFI